MQQHVYSTPSARSYSSIQGYRKVQLEVPQRNPSWFIPAFTLLVTVQPPFDLVSASAYKQQKNTKIVAVYGSYIKF